MLVLCLLFTCAEAAAPVGNPLPTVESLDGTWRLHAEQQEITWRVRYWDDLIESKCLNADYDDSKWTAAEVPGYVQFACDLRSFWWGYDLYQVNFKPWLYRKVFPAPAGITHIPSRSAP